jgi:spermidine synthase
MSPKQTKEPARPAATSRYMPGLLLLFVGSGCAALIYEIVWFQLLSLIIGSSAVSMGVLLATFMGGMCAGALLLPRFVSAKEHPLRVYALLEVGIALFGLLALFGLPWVGGLYTAVGGPGMTGIMVRALICALCLLPPTILMGATLPAIARWVETTPKGVSWLGFFYGGNIVGAVFGCLLAGIGFGLAKVTPHEPPVIEPKLATVSLPPGSWPVILAIALSGMTALAAEVIWARLFSLLLGATVYTFSLILAAFLAGLGIGSGFGSWAARSIPNPRAALGICQLLLMAGIAWAAFWLTRGLPYWPIDPSISPGPAFTFQIDLVRCLWTVLPPAVLWGASFPLALAAVAARGQDPGRLVGTVYAANTVGAIAGALLASLLIIAWIGTQQGQRLLIVLAGVSALLVLVPAVAASGRLVLQPLSTAWAGATAVLAAIFVASVAPVPPMLIAYGRYMTTRLPSQAYLEFIYVGEGMNSSMAVSRLWNGVLNYHNAGKVQASSEPQDMGLQRMLGHLTTLLPTDPQSVLVIGCGAGVTAGAVSIDPAVRQVVIAEIEPLVPHVVSTYFSEHNYAVITNPKVRLEIDDARHYLLTTGEKFDAITSDPFDPWVKGAATLYTREFFEVMKQHLNPGGVVTVFVQLYESSMDAVKSEIATFFEVFPDGFVMGNTQNGQGYDLVLVGFAAPATIDIDAIEAKLRRPEYQIVARSLSEIGVFSTVQLFSRFAGHASDLRPWLRDAQINRDRNLRLQYLAGLGLNLYQQDAIYRDMLSHRRYPEQLFTGSPDQLDALRASILWGE